MKRSPVCGIRTPGKADFASTLMTVLGGVFALSQKQPAARGKKITPPGKARTGTKLAGVRTY